MVLRALVVAAMAAAVGAKVPTFAKDWEADEANTLAIYQGDYIYNSDYYCCSVAGRCKVQTSASSSHTNFDYTNKRVRSGDIISFFGSIRKVRGRCLQHVTCA